MTDYTKRSRHGINVRLPWGSVFLGEGEKIDVIVQHCCGSAGDENVLARSERTGGIGSQGIQFIGFQHRCTALPQQKHQGDDISLFVRITENGVLTVEHLHLSKLSGFLGNARQVNADFSEAVSVRGQPVECHFAVFVIVGAGIDHIFLGINRARAAIEAVLA